MAIRDQENIKWPNPLKPNVENQDQYCHFCRSRGHTTEDISDNSSKAHLLKMMLGGKINNNKDNH
ncbi:hypothetical protein IEQ34_019311 [Dendrobium chrysotoxum]|uniref:Uncharacterized protein n=1 Tax=Dendrobium chrysotoxum TaxID=161865 RepID=A0AAV7G925_DENCH|nr:hypothetical protein IEQ34_019311 [Dendrobium chrysotoxum]